jgi:hypothetical protein
MSQEPVRTRIADGDVRLRTTQSNAPTNGAAVEQVQEVRERELPDGFDLRHDRVHWGPIIAGLLTAFTTLLLLS